MPAPRHVRAAAAAAGRAPARPVPVDQDQARRARRRDGHRSPRSSRGWARRAHLGPSRTLPLAIVISLIVTQVAGPRHDLAAARDDRRRPGRWRRRLHPARARDEPRRGRASSPRRSTPWPTTCSSPTSSAASSSRTSRTSCAPRSPRCRRSSRTSSTASTRPTPRPWRPRWRRPSGSAGSSTYLLDLSRLEAGDAPLRDQRTCALAELPARGRRRAALVGAAKHLRFPVDVEPPDLTVPADPERLHQVVANLLHNAVRHSPAGRRGPPGRDAASDRDVRIDVVDDGPGIAASAAAPRLRALRARQHPGHDRARARRAAPGSAWRSSAGRSSCTAARIEVADIRDGLHDAGHASGAGAPPTGEIALTTSAAVTGRRRPVSRARPRHDLQDAPTTSA